MEYAIVLGSKIGSLIDLNSFGEVFPILLPGILLTVSGYLLKGGWGAALALFAGTILFFYCDGKLPF